MVGYAQNEQTTDSVVHNDKIGHLDICELRQNDSERHRWRIAIIRRIVQDYAQDRLEI